MTTGATKADALQQIEDARAHWHHLVNEVGEDRMEQPSLPGEWTFKDLAAHLTFWREWTVARIEAGPGGEAATLWPSGLTTYKPDDPDATNWDPINAWVYAQQKDRSVRDVLDDAESSFNHLVTAVAGLPANVVETPRRFAWLGDEALAEAEFGEHLREEHEADVHAWLRKRAG